MLAKLLQNRHLVLGSGSPRRSDFLRELGLDFEVRLQEFEESYPSELKREEISEYLAKLKAKALEPVLSEEEILITADTIVWCEDEALGKPKDREEAIKMLQSLSNKSHEVISSVALTTTKKQVLLSDTTTVNFRKLTDEEIVYYVDHYEPFDKAGAYGIQEWLGYIGITEIRGSYFNVVGFPVQKFYTGLRDLLADQS
jgi:septum formation protein